MLFHLSLIKADELLLLNWDEYLADSVIEAFEAETGHTIKVVIFDSDNKRDEILSSSAGNQFDLVMIDSVSAQLFGKNNVLHSSNIEQLNILEKIDPRWRESCGNFGVPYAWGTVGIAYRSDKIETPPSSWSELIVPSTGLKGHVGMLLDQVDTFIPALKLQGDSINTENIEELKNAYIKLLNQKESLLTYEYPISYQEKMGNDSELYMALAYSGDQYVLNGDDEDGPWRYIVPKEGTSAWVDCLSIVESSLNKPAAKQFLSFINRPEVAAENASEIWFATANLNAIKFIDEELVSDESIFPPQQLIDSSEQYQILSNKNISQRSRIIGRLNK
jgi:spermidine/putrescine transport system substrate-binding protein